MIAYKNDGIIPKKRYASISFGKVNKNRIINRQNS